jgi:hypothetical protein
MRKKAATKSQRSFEKIRVRRGKTMPDFDAKKHMAEITAYFRSRSRKRGERLLRPLSIGNPITLQGFDGNAIVIARLSRQLMLEEVDQHRFHSCGMYETCLNYADKRRWYSFTCSLCPVFQARLATMS